MSIADRKAKEKEELKSLILSAAKKLFIEKGVDCTTVRNIADEIDYSVGTIYVYYKDKNEILYEINSLGFQQLREQMLSSLAIKHPMEKLKSILLTYIDFAMNNKELYDLMFIMNAPMLYLEGSEHKEWCQGKGAYGVLMDVMKECVDFGCFNKDQSIDSLSLSFWGLAHGMVSLCIRKRLTAIDYPEDVIVDVINNFFKLINK